MHAEGEIGTLLLSVWCAGWSVIIVCSSKGSHRFASLCSHVKLQGYSAVFPASPYQKPKGRDCKNNEQRLHTAGNSSSKAMSTHVPTHSHACANHKSESVQQRWQAGKHDLMHSQHMLMTWHYRCDSQKGQQIITCN